MFYNRYYRPENALIVVVGDVNPAYVEMQIKDLYSNWKTGKSNHSPVKQPQAKMTYKQTGSYFERNLASELSGVMNKKATMIIDDKKYRSLKAARKIANNIFAKRLKRVVSKEQKGDWIHVIYSANKEGDIASFIASADKYQHVIDIFDTERRRIIEHEFTQEEVDIALKNIEIYIDNELENANKVRAATTANVILQYYNFGKIFQSEKQLKMLFDENTKAITREDYQQAFIDMWEDFEPRIWMRSNRDPSTLIAKVVNTLEQSRLRDVTPYEQSKLPEFKLKGLEQPGTITSKNIQAKTGIVRTQFSNGVLMNYKRTKFRNKEVILNINFDGNFYPIAEEFTQYELMASALGTADLYKYSRADLKEIFAQKKINMSLRVSKKRLLLQVRTNSESMEDALKTATAFITYLNFNSPSWQRRHNRNVNAINRYKASMPLLNGQLSLDYVLSGENHKFFYTPSSHRSNVYREKFALVIDTYLLHGAIEIGVVGDFEEENLIQAVSQTLGALPKRKLQVKENNEKPSDT